MTHLAEYVHAMHAVDQDHNLKITKMETAQQSYQESDTEVNSSLFTYYFEDGAIIEQSIEQDQLELKVESCIESWIQYKVIQQPISVEISPSRIEFDSHCRELHWINYFKIR